MVKIKATKVELSRLLVPSMGQASKPLDPTFPIMQLKKGTLCSFLISLRVDALFFFLFFFVACEDVHAHVRGGRDRQSHHLW